MVERGNFFASMFIVLAAGCFISYFMLGYSTNTVAQVGRYPFYNEIYIIIIQSSLSLINSENKV